jgi:hypothetical protein
MQPHQLPAETDLCTANGRAVRRTRSGLLIGLRYNPPPIRQWHDEVRMQEVLLHRRPLAVDQLYVEMMCRPTP